MNKTKEFISKYYFKNLPIQINTVSSSPETKGYYINFSSNSNNQWLDTIEDDRNKILFILPISPYNKFTDFINSGVTWSTIDIQINNHKTSSFYVDTLDNGDFIFSSDIPFPSLNMNEFSSNEVYITFKGNKNYENNYNLYTQEDIFCFPIETTLEDLEKQIIELNDNENTTIIFPEDLTKKCIIPIKNYNLFTNDIPEGYEMIINGNINFVAPKKMDTLSFDGSGEDEKIIILDTPIGIGESYTIYFKKATSEIYMGWAASDTADILYDQNTHYKAEGRYTITATDEPIKIISLKSKTIQKVYYELYIDNDFIDLNEGEEKEVAPGILGYKIISDADLITYYDNVGNFSASLPYNTFSNTVSISLLNKNYNKIYQGPELLTGPQVNKFSISNQYYYDSKIFGKEEAKYIQFNYIRYYLVPNLILPEDTIKAVYKIPNDLKNPEDVKLFTMEIKALTSSYELNFTNNNEIMIPFTPSCKIEITPEDKKENIYNPIIDIDEKGYITGISKIRLVNQNNFDIEITAEEYLKFISGYWTYSSYTALDKDKNILFSLPFEQNLSKEKVKITKDSPYQIEFYTNKIGASYPVLDEDINNLPKLKCVQRGPIYNSKKIDYYAIGGNGNIVSSNENNSSNSLGYFKYDSNKDALILEFPQ